MQRRHETKTPSVESRTNTSYSPVKHLLQRFSSRAFFISLVVVLNGAFILRYPRDLRVCMQFPVSATEILDHQIDWSPAVIFLRYYNHLYDKLVWSKICVF